MKKKKEIIIRKAQPQDLVKLQTFFIKVYGEATIFQYEPLLEWCFNSKQKNSTLFEDSIVGINPDGEIISHYGGLKNLLKIDDQIIPMMWGVNSFTLQEWQGKGANSKIVELLLEKNEINGIIAFTDKTASFYDRIGYNLFDHEKFSRHIYIVDRIKTEEILNFLEQDNEKLKEIDISSKDHKEPFVNKNIIKLNKSNINNFNIEFDVDIFATTHRDRSFINWRFLHHPLIDYDVYALLHDNTIIAYVACREEVLHPLKHKANRIIDLFGNQEGVSDLLDFIIQRSTENNHIYIDFSIFGYLYDDILLSHGFCKLEGDDITIFPQVTAPMINRPNRDYVGFQSHKYKGKIDLMKKDNVYFTRMDSDSDRLAGCSQIVDRLSNEK